MIRLAEIKKEYLISNYLRTYIHVIEFAPKERRFNFCINPEAPRDLTRKINEFFTRCLSKNKWHIAIEEYSNNKGQPTVIEQEHKLLQKQRREIENNPMIALILEKFPDSEIIKVVDYIDDLEYLKKI